MIDKNSPLPIYYQLSEHIRQHIHSEQLKPGDLLPSEREYTEIYQISRMTVRQAINHLVTEGLLYSIKGKGTFVAEKKFEQDLLGLTSFSEDMKSRGFTPGNKLISFQSIPVTETIAETLQLSPEETVYEIKRIRLANDAPVALETIYTPEKVTGKLMEHHLAFSFYQFIEEKLGYSIQHADQIIEAASANQLEAKHLSLEAGEPVLVMQRLSYLNDAQETPLEFVHSAYRADKYKFKLRMNR